MIKNKKVKILTISILCILTLAIGLSYGYYLLNRVQKNGNVAGSQCFNLEFTNEKNAINLDNMYPISDEEGKKLTPYSFTITNTCDMLAGYTVNMEMLEGTTLNSKYLDVMVNNEEIKLLTNYESTDTVITGSTESRILAKGTLAYNDSVDYTVRFWMDKDVEDVDSMNKYFASKIVVVATPSSWNPKDAGYDTLHDAILANEYQSTPEDALKKIEAKGEPDLSQTAPTIKWIENTGEIKVVTANKPADDILDNVNFGTQGLSSTASLLKLGKSYIFNVETGKYDITDFDYYNPTVVDFESDNYYFCNAGTNYNSSANKMTPYDTVSNCDKIYQISSAAMEYIGTANSINHRIRYSLTGKEMIQSELETDKSDKGLYQAIDDYGITYYYRGNVINNNVYFGGFYWKIVRINGNDSIRLLYNGIEKNSFDINQSINSNTYRFNDLYNSPAYVGYMYGDNNGNSFDELHNNINSSSIKENIESWFENNIINKGYSNYIENNIGFCGDRTLSSGDGISTNKYSYFGTNDRDKNDILIFTCPNIDRDLYTVANSDIGNKSLIYPVGLITYDELRFSGMNSSKINKLSWSYSDFSYWTLSPSSFGKGSGSALVWIAQTSGVLNGGFGVQGNILARPVINLRSDVKITGGIGTTNDPFVIDTN